MTDITVLFTLFSPCFYPHSFHWSLANAARTESMCFAGFRRGIEKVLSFKMFFWPWKSIELGQNVQSIEKVWKF